MTIEPDLRQAVAEALKRCGFSLALMESCTGGLLSYEISSTPGCGDFFLGSLVSYATRVKKLLGVPSEVIEKYGVVSQETAAAMARAARECLNADVGIGLTGVAGPAPQDGVHVGVVYVALDGEGRLAARVSQFDFGKASPDEIKSWSVREALTMLASGLNESENARPQPTGN